MRRFAGILTFVIMLSAALHSSPEAVSTLTPLAGAYPNEIRLEWIYPGPESLPSGSTFYVQHATWTGGAWDTSSAGLVISTGPVPAFEAQSCVITGLAGDLTYYFRVWTASGTDGLLSSISNGATYYMPADAFLVVDKEFSVTTKKPGGIITYRMVYRNAGNTEATSVTLRDRLPLHLDYQTNSIVVDGIAKTDVQDSESGPDAQISGDIISVVFDSYGLSPGATGYVEFQARIR